MIQVREVFQLQFGKAREAIALAREGIAIEERHGGAKARLLTDVTGAYYTLIMECEYESLAAFEQGLQAGTANEEFRAWYPRFAALALSGRREIYRIV
jgi:hypothetical protein